jgi:hypothetical protein
MAESRTRRASLRGSAASVEPPVGVKIAPASAAPGVPQQIIVGPEVKAVSQATIAVSAHDLTVSFGVTRMAIDPATLMPTGGQIVEWTDSHAMSATTAKAFHGALGQSLKKYEKEYGKIPTDPKATVDIKGS